MKMFRGQIAVVLLALSCYQTRADKMKEENEADVKELKTLLKDTVKVDLTSLFTQHNKLDDQAIDVFKKTFEYVDLNIKELNTHLETRIKDFDENTLKNLEALETNTKDMLVKMNENIMLNLKTINEKTMEERKEIIKWAHQRAHLHEDILKTKITACAHDHAHFGKGVVDYSSDDGGYIEDSVSIRVWNTTDIKKEDLLSLKTGIFKVPANAAGEYVFTFSVTIDSFDQKMMASSYSFAKGGTKIEGTEIYADVGTSHTNDRAPGSRQIFLKLKENDEISVIQTRDTDIEDFHVSFCGALLHLDKASESPGGGVLFADATAPEFPLGTLAEQEFWEYQSPVFTDSKPIVYEYKEKEKKPPFEDLFKEAVIEKTDWKTPERDWTLTNKKP